MTYEQALDLIHATTRLGSRLGLERIRKLLELLDYPQKKLKFIHVAGTNGKGSTVAMAASILQKAGFRTGMYISPFVMDFRERMQVDGVMVEKQEMADILAGMLPILEQMKKAGSECTEFEVVTAIALCWFAARQCDVVVLEVGLGGRFDATNVIDPPACCAIALISLDHTEFLGSTTAKIAFEKCGIIKEGSRVAAYATLPKDARQVVEECCTRLGITPNFPDLSQLKVLSCASYGSEIVYKGEQYFISLVGEHQVSNALTVLSILEELNASGWNVSLEDIRWGIAHTGFGGRLEVVCEEPLCIIDGAHNEEAVDMLCRALDHFYFDRRVIAVMGMLSDKKYEYCIHEVARRCNTFIAAKPGSPRALDARQVAECAAEVCENTVICSDPFGAARMAVSLAKPEDVVLACGSLYMIGAAKRGFQA